jgi:carbon-monoxide dehydrogenase small subunit
MMLPKKIELGMQVNGRQRQAVVEPRRLLCDFLRQDLGLTGTHVGCEHGICGACTVIVNGEPVKSCLMLAVQAADAQVLTVEGLAGADGTLHPLQQAFSEHHALQCGYCTPGMLLAAVTLLEENPHPSVEEIQVGMDGNLCRCTGYYNIVTAIRAFAERQQHEVA